MQAYIAQRILLMVPALIGVTLIVFIAARLAPVDTVNVILGDTGIKDEAIKNEIRSRLGLDQSIPQQYLSWFGGMVQGDFGKSWYTGESIRTELSHRLPVSFELGTLSLILSISLAIPLGTIAALKQDSWIDNMTRGVAVLLLSIPSFWLGLIIVGLGYYFWAWAPPAEYNSFAESPSEHIRVMMWPVLVLGLTLAGTEIRLVRSSLLEVLRQDYIRTARAKGLREMTVLTGHALKNAMIPVVTVIGLQLPIVVAGSVVLENIFMVPGIGRYVVQASTQYDFPIMQSVVVMVATVIMVSNLAVDVSYGWLDPRIRFR